MKQASKFAEQLSGAVNKKVMGLDDSAPAGDVVAEGWEGAEAAAAAAAGGVAGVGMAQGWKPPTAEPGMDQELANDVPSELSIDEQVRCHTAAGSVFSDSAVVNTEWKTP